MHQSRARRGKVWMVLEAGSGYDRERVGGGVRDGDEAARNVRTYECFECGDDRTGRVHSLPAHSNKSQTSKQKQLPETKP